MDKPSLARKIGRALETGGMSLVFEKDGYDPPPERLTPDTRLGRIVEALATGGFSLITPHVEPEPVIEDSLQPRGE